jgi:hypothetical protein
MTKKMVVGSNPTSHALRQRLWDLVTWSLFLLFVRLSCEFAGWAGGSARVIVKLCLMLRMGSPLSKAAGGLAIVIALLSAVFVIAAQCHNSQSSPVVAASSHHHDGAAHGLAHASAHLVVPVSSGALAESVGSGVLGSSLMGELCAGVFFIVLVLGRKFLLKIFALSTRVPAPSFRSFTQFSLGVARLRTALTLPQLGICRI